MSGLQCFNSGRTGCPKTNAEAKSIVTLKGIEDERQICSPFSVKHSSPFFFFKKVSV